MGGRLGKCLLSNIVCKHRCTGGKHDLSGCSILFNLIQLLNFWFDLILRSEINGTVISISTQPLSTTTFECLELYLQLPSVPSWHVGDTLTFIIIIIRISNTLSH
jgi:hypothetical protein